MKIKYKANFKGYIPVLRSLQLLLKDKTLTFAQLGAYICFVAQADFDNKHRNYTVIVRDDYELAKEWACSPSTVHRQRKELRSKGLLYEDDDGLTRIKNFALFELSWVKTFTKFPPVLLKLFFAITLEESLKEAKNIANLQDDQVQKVPQSSSISSKGELSSSRLSSQTDTDINELGHEPDRIEQSPKEEGHAD